MSVELYNPMTGTRLDLEVTKEDGAAAAKTHRRWIDRRIAYLEDCLRTCSADAREFYERELAITRESK
jgi:transcription elongation GreA/GreB family factor